MRLIALFGLLLSLLSITPPLLRAGDGIPVPSENPESDTAALLGQDYKDESNGFKLQVPFGARIFQRHGLELVSFVHDAKQWGGNVQHKTLDKNIIVEELLINSSGDLKKVFKVVQILESRATIVSGKPAGKLVSALEAEYPTAVDNKGRPLHTQTIPLLRQELMVQTATNQYMVLTFFAPLAQKEDAIRAFDAMIGTFDLLDRKAIEARRLAAVKVGQDWLARIHAEDLTTKILNNPQYFRIKIENHDVGYLRLDETAVNRDPDASTDSYTGIVVVASSRTFPADGSLILGSNKSFWAYHNQGGKLGELPSYSTWDNRAGTLVPNDPTRPAGPHIKSTDIPNGKVIHGVAELPPSGVVRWSEEIGVLQMSLHPTASTNHDILFKPQYDLDVTTMADTEDVLRQAHNRPLHWTITPEPSIKHDPGQSTPAQDMGMPAPLPKPLEYLWPRLVDLTKESQMALVVYNSAQHKLGLRILTVGKPEMVTIDSETFRLTRLTDELGSNATTLWVDDKGIIKMMRTSDGSVLLPSTEDKLQLQWSVTLSKFK